MLMRLFKAVVSWLKRKLARRSTTVEFCERFPGRCPICSYHEFGMREGFVRLGEAVPPHDQCPEGLSRWCSPDCVV